jgi:hypothetical protein
VAADCLNVEQRSERRRLPKQRLDQLTLTVRVRACGGLHPKQHAHPTRGTRNPRPFVRETDVLVEVGRLPARPYPPQLL